MIRYISLKGTPFKHLDFCKSKAISKRSTECRDSLRKKSQNSTCIFNHKHLNFITSNCIHQIQACSLKTNSNSSHSGLMEGGYKITDQFAMYYLTFTLVGWVDLFTRRQCSQIPVSYTHLLCSMRPYALCSMPYALCPLLHYLCKNKPQCSSPSE